MRHTRSLDSAVDVSIGFAADERGAGVAYARVRSASGENVVRKSFRVRRSGGLEGREIGYAAVAAVAGALREWGARRVRFLLDDARLVDDVVAHRDVPDAIVLPYVRLRCALNQFDDFRLQVAADSDLSQRARAEVALHTAA